MKFTIVLYAAPYSSQASLSALRFTQAALDSGHEIVRVFFYYEGVYNTNALSVPPQDEFDLVEAWNSLITTHGIDAVSCVSSALKRGILNAQESDRYERKGNNLLGSVALSGLGQLVDATLTSDRVISFGA